MANITLRSSPGDYTPVSTSYNQKGGPLTHIELDENFDKMNRAVELVQVDAQDFAVAVAIALG